MQLNRTRGSSFALCDKEGGIPANYFSLFLDLSTNFQKNEKSKINSVNQMYNEENNASK